MVELHRANDDHVRQTMEAILLCRDVDDNTRVAAWLSTENRHCFDDLNEAEVTIVRAVAPMGATVEQCLRALPVRVVDVTNYAIRQGATRALAAT